MTVQLAKNHTKSDSMTTVAIPMARPNLRKRPFERIAVPLDGSSSREDAEHSERQPKHIETSKSPDQPHPQLLEQVQVTEANGPHSHMAVSAGPAIEDADIAAASGASSVKPTTKRQKVAAAEQETRRKEKEIKDRQRLEEKAKRDDEKEEKRKAREVQTKAKEEDKIQREKACSSVDWQASPKSNGQSPESSRRSSISTLNDGVNSRGRSASPKPSKMQLLEYERLFPPFYVQAHTTLAPETRFSRDEDGLKYARNKIDEELQASEDTRLSIGAFNPFELLHISTHQQSSRSRQRNTVKDLLARIHGTSENPIDLTGSRAKAVDKPTALLAAIPVKYLSFSEDVRPPYIGTYTKVSDPRTCSKLRRNPFTRSLPTNYDYDSEAEWEEPGEGEDLGSEGEEEVGEDDEEDEMDGFLDDDEAGDGNRMANAKRRLVASDLEPHSIGICWETSTHGYRSKKEDQGLDLEPFRLEMISGKPGLINPSKDILTGVETFELPIDPYTTTYWQPRPREVSQAQWVIHTPMDPPRIPLTHISRPNNVKNVPSMTETLKVPTARTELLMPAKPSRAPKRLIAVDILEAFKNAVAGSDLTKAGLVEVLKKQ
ncbi:hypothetical protein MMC22_007095 [Lobaria immixta]|nr:hypothetical protein [Lobaria immixta]